MKNGESRIVSTLAVQFERLDARLSFDTTNYIQGTPGDDVFYIQVQGETVLVNLNGVDSVYLIADPSADVVIAGGDGNDQMMLGLTGLKIVLVGNAGNDYLWAQSMFSGSETMRGGRGDDTLLGGNGTDLLYGGNGNDYLGGGPHEDTLFGGGGDDTLVGGRSSDVIDGGEGNDFYQCAGDPIDFQRTVFSDFITDSGGYDTGTFDEIDVIDGMIESLTLVPENF